MLAKNDKDIEKAYEVLQVMSQSREKRMAYEARQAELMDQRTREKTAREEGGKEKAKDIAKKMLAAGLEMNFIIQMTGLMQAEIEEIKNRH